MPLLYRYLAETRLVGILSVDPAVREFGDRDGMTNSQLSVGRSKNGPLAARDRFLAGVRVATVTTIGTATIAAADRRWRGWESSFSFREKSLRWIQRRFSAGARSPRAALPGADLGWRSRLDRKKRFSGCLTADSGIEALCSHPKSIQGRFEEFQPSRVILGEKSSPQQIERRLQQPVDRKASISEAPALAHQGAHGGRYRSLPRSITGTAYTNILKREVITDPRIILGADSATCTKLVCIRSG